MIDVSLEQLSLYVELKRRADRSPLARTLSGLLHPIAGDAREILELVRQSCTSFTRHNIQHSFVIVHRVGQILSPKALKGLSSIEIFCFILAAMFHDSGMITFDAEASSTARANHPSRSGELLARYMDDRMKILSEYNQRLISCTAFVMESHGLTWESMSSRREFNTPNSVASEPLRCSLLAILLRVGDLLDLDSDRSCDALRRHGEVFFRDPVSRTHHDRHKRVSEFNCDDQRIHILIEPHTREEHQIWHEWLDYLKQDILHANTYVFTGPLAGYRLPEPSLELKPAKGASYDVLPLRFELDESARLWDVISQSIYTGAFDFVREIIQNAIDAGLATVFSDRSATLPHPSPRCWLLPGFAPRVTIAYSQKRQSLRIRDNGIGMTRRELSDSLFKVAHSGFSEAVTPRDFRFPSIATFGIGFVSVLVRAARVHITSRRRQSLTSSEQARRVTITAGARDAYVERVDEVEFGTMVDLVLREPYSADKLRNWIESTFRYPSVPIVYVDLDRLEELMLAAQRLSIPVPAQVSNVASLGICNGTEDAELINRLTNIVSKNFEDTDTKIGTKRDVGRAAPPALVVDRAPLPMLPKDPIFASLGNPVTLPAPGIPPKFLRNVACIVWVPVEFDNLELGIEWRSMHGFVASGGKVRRSTPVSVPKSWSRYEDYDDYYAIHGEDDVNDDADDTDDRRRRGRSSIAWIHVEDDCLEVRESSEDITGLPIQRYIEDVLTEDPRVRYGERGQIEASTLPASISSDTLRGFRVADSLSGLAFQDGILMPIRPHWIAPLGACRATLNLTAGARLRLNVTRNSIDESPTLVREWCQSVAVHVQKAVVRKAITAFQLANWTWDKQALWPNDQDHLPSLLSHSVIELRRLIAGAYAEIS